MRSSVKLFALCSFAAMLLSPALAQTDGKPLRIIVPFATGGSQDVIARYLGEKLGSRLGVPVIVENKVGAGGMLAADYVAKGPADGTTVLLATGGAISIAPSLNPRLPYSPQKDLAPVALIADTPMTVAVRANSAYKTLGDVLKDARAHPGVVSFASTGNGTVSHLSGELLAQAANVRLLHVPYRGAGPALTDLLGGQVQLLMTSAASIEPMVESGKARLLGTFSRTSLPGLANLPTVSDVTGLQGLEAPVWVGVMAPARTPAARIEKLSSELVALCKLPETRTHFAQLGAVPTCGDPGALQKVVTDDTRRWAEVVKRGGIKPD
ncbi:Bug family tripartite tricarboxylate transporter substrate binding protein [Cupriavidus sp. 2TAF22]|uniref:Bug family tripartite tricarboxylate transporter substrate binding protein n=1 Tax=unclassified Cupriavidus TaxID=2640874 RepID=UPI003F8DC346